MRFLYLIAVAVCLLSPLAASTQSPIWAVVSTEVDDTSPSPGFYDEQALRLLSPAFAWSNDPSDIFFDPLVEVLGFDPGLDAYHYEAASFQGQPFDIHYFSTEIGFYYEDTLYGDEEVLIYDSSTGTLSKLFNVTDFPEISFDVGLDAISTAITGYCSCNPIEGWAFSSEVSTNLFTDGDILITDGLFLSEVIGMEQVFGTNLGLDAVHMIEYEYTDLGLYRQFAISTEEGGFIGEGADRVDFTGQDIIVLSFMNGIYSGDAQVVWWGEEAFGRDVGLDALYLHTIPEPSIMALLFTGLGILAARKRSA